MSVRFAPDSPAAPRMSSAEIASFTSAAREIDVGGDDMIDLGSGDDLGIGLLANPNKVSASPRSSSSGRQITTSIGGSSSEPHYNAMPSIQIKPIDDLGIVDLESGPVVSGLNIHREPPPQQHREPFVIDLSSGSGSGSSSSGGANTEMKEKKRLLAKIQRLDRATRLTLQSPLEELKDEFDKLTDVRRLEASIQFQRNLLLTFVNGVEMTTDSDFVRARLPKQVQPKLTGWSESIQSDIEPFDEIFEEMYDLYKDSASFHPLVRLMMTLGASGAMMHITNTMAEKSGIPGMADLLKENPELQRQFAAAAMSKMGGVGQFLSGVNGLAPTSASAPQPFNSVGLPASAGTRGMPFNVAGAAIEESSQPKRREMAPPSSVPDMSDILSAFQVERATQAGPSISQVHAAVFTPTGPPPVPPQTVSKLREGLGGPNDPLREFSSSGASVNGGSDSQSVGSGIRSRGRPRQRVEPVGETMIVNI